MGETVDNIFTFLIIGGSIALVICGIMIAKPNLHGINFVEGNCTITHATTINEWDDLPKCSCGKNCQEEYPCVSVYASFESSVDGMSFISGTLHKDYNALSKDCLVIPDCSNFESNQAGVSRYYFEEVVPRVNYDTSYPTYNGYSDSTSWLDIAGSNISTDVTYSNMSSFDCWGYDNYMYFDHSYTALNVYLSLGIPSGCIIAGLVLSCTFGSSQQRELVGYMIILPILLLGVVAEALGCGLPHCRRPSCNCCKKRRRETRAVDLEVMGMGAPRAADFRSRVRDEAEAGMAISLESSSSNRSHVLEYDNRRDTIDMAIEISLQPQYNPRLQPQYPSAVEPPSYNAFSYPSAPVATITAPLDASPYTSTMDLPPPPSYDTVFSSDHGDTGYNS